MPDTLRFKVVLSLDMVQPYMFPKTIVSVDVKPVEVKHDVNRMKSILMLNRVLNRSLLREMFMNIV